MDKFKSYLGLALAALLGWLFLSPQRQSMFHDNMSVTPLDRTAISLIAQESSTEFKLLRRVNAYVRRCPRGPDTSYRNRCEINFAAPYSLEMISMMWHFEKYDRGFADAANDYFNTDYDDPSRNQKLSELEKRAMTAYPKLMADIRSSYQVTVYALHALFALLLVLIVIFRKNVGAAVVWPIASISKLIFRAARKTHEKI